MFLLSHSRANKLTLPNFGKAYLSNTLLFHFFGGEASDCINRLTHSLSSSSWYPE